MHNLHSWAHTRVRVHIPLILNRNNKDGLLPPGSAWFGTVCLFVDRWKATYVLGIMGTKNADGARSSRFSGGKKISSSARAK